MSETRKKLVVVGDDGCGKSCLLLVFKEGIFPPDWNAEAPKILQNNVAEVDVDGRKMELVLWNTSGNDDHHRLRPLSYPGSDVILICFSIDSPDSLRNVQDKWIAEIVHFSPKAPIILVGCKVDLRNDTKTFQGLSEKGQKPVSTEDGQAMAKQINARSYLECSSKDKSGIKELFDAALRAALEHRKSKRCQIV